MKALFILAMTLCPTSAFAQVSTQYPFCLQGDDYPGWSNCSFTSYQQCQASASGTNDECLANPWFSLGGNPAPASDESQIGLNGPIPIGPPPQN